jgi:hypothetical protein
MAEESTTSSGNGSAVLFYGILITAIIAAAAYGVSYKSASQRTPKVRQEGPSPVDFPPHIADAP